MCYGFSAFHVQLEQEGLEMASVPDGMEEILAGFQIMMAFSKFVRFDNFMCVSGPSANS